MKKSFTVIEVIVAIFVVTIGVLSAFNVVQTIISYTFTSASRLEAAYLAEEGIEIVRNTRDSNWIQGIAWNGGLPSGTAFVMGSKYERTITITPDGADKIKVLVEVKWQEKGESRIIAVQENLYNWYENL